MQDIESEAIKLLSADCAALQVTVKITSTSEYITGVFTKDSSVPQEIWESYWGGFQSYVKLLLAKYGIHFLGVATVDNNTVEAYFGTLFDALSR